MSKLERQILKEVLKPFGQIVENIGLHLSHHGALSLSCLSTGLGSSLKVIKEGLFILLHHRLISFKKATVGNPFAKDDHLSGPKLYSICWRSVEYRLFFPIWILKIKMLYEDLAASIVMQILLHSFVSIEDLITKFPDPLKTREVLVMLIDYGFVVIYGKLEKGSCDSELACLDEDHHLVHKTPFKSGKSSKLSKQPSSSESMAFIPSKRVRLESDDSQLVTYNPWRFIYEAHSEYLQAYMTGSINENAGLILKVILHACSQSIPNVSFDAQLPIIPSFSISLFQIANELSSGIALDIEHADTTGTTCTTTDALKEYLSLICHYSEGFLTPSGPFNASCSLVYNINSAFEFIRSKTLQAHIKEKFDPISYKIYRLLESKHILEEKQIQGMIKESSKDTRDKLYGLFKQGYIQIQELGQPSVVTMSSSSINSGINNRLYYLWKFEIKKIKDVMIKLAYKSIINCWERALFERSTHALLLSKAILAASAQTHRQSGSSTSIEKDSTGSSHAESLVLSDIEKRQLEALNKRLERLELNALRLPKLLLYIEPFYQHHYEHD